MGEWGSASTEIEIPEGGIDGQTTANNNSLVVSGRRGVRCAVVGH